MRSLKRILLVGGIVAAIAIGVGIGTWLHIGMPGSVPITTWIARQIASVLESYITPKISFASLEYRRPLTVIIRDFALTSEDRSLISADRIVLGLAEIPRQGRPIKIREIDLENPHLAIEFRPDGQLIGWSGFIRPEVLRNPHVVPEGRRFSDVLVLRHVQIRGGDVRYRGPGDPEAMVLPGIEMTLNTLPDEKEPGWYGLIGDLKREPIFNANIDARLNLDTSLLELKTFTLAATLGEKQYKTLPPRLQALLRRHQVHGELAATFAGQVPIPDPAQTAGSVAASLKDAHLTVGQAAISLASLQVSGTLPDGKVSLETGRGALTQDGHTLIAMEQFRVELPAIPTGKGPVEIDSLDLIRGQAELIADSRGGFLGWSYLGTNENADIAGAAPGGQAQSRGPPATAPGKSDQGLNQYVRIRQAAIHDSRFAFGLPGGGAPLELDHIDLNLQPDPHGNADDWQPVTASARTEGLFAATLAGRFDQARLNLDLDRFKLTSNITGEPQYARLPPQIQNLLRSHRAQGKLTATFTGLFPIMHPAQTRGTLTAHVRSLSLTVGAAAIALAGFRVSGAIPDGQVKLEARKGALVQGGHTLLAIDHLLAELPAIPRGDKPIEITSLDVERAHAELIAAPEGGFVGWNQIEQTGENAAEKTSSQSSQPLRMDKTRIQKAEIRDSSISCGLPGGGTPLVLDQVNLSLQPDPNEKTGSRRRIAASAVSKGLLVTSLGGWIDMASLILDLDQFRLAASITGELQYKPLPEPIESIFREHGVTGDLSLQFQGRVPLMSIKQTAGRAALHLDNAQMHFAAIDLPVGQAQFDFDVPVAGIRADLTNLALVSGKTHIVDIRRMRMNLAGPPQVHGPLQIQSATFEHPLLRFVLAKDHGFLGWRDLGHPEAPWPRLSDFVRFEQMRIDHGEVLLDTSKQDKSDPMILSGINAQFRTPPVAGSPGWYRLAVSVGKAPLFDAQLDGRINPDAMLLDADSFSLQAELGERQYAALPPQLQTFLRQHEVQGNVTLTAKGRVPMLDPAQSKLAARVDLRDAHIAFTDVHWPVKRVLVDTRMGGGKITADYGANLLGGKVGGDVRVSLDPPHPLQGTWTVNGLRMEDTLRLVQQGPPKYAGLIDSEGSFNANLDGFPATLCGRGTLGVANGRLIELPVIHDLIRVIRGLTLGIVPKQHDTAKAQFRLCSDRVEVSRLEVKSTAVILRVIGDIYYDQRVDLGVKTRLARKAGQNVGKGIGRIGALGGLSPFRTVSERTGRVLGNGLGEVANALSIGEHIVSYRVSGTLSNPRISVKMLAKRR